VFRLAIKAEKTENTEKDLLARVKKNKEGVDVVDLRFMDLLGEWQHFTVPRHAINEESLRSGIGFDGSSIRTWQAIHESDMLVLPDGEMHFIDPFFQAKTLDVICDVLDPVTRESYGKDPRLILGLSLSFLFLTRFLRGKM